MNKVTKIDENFYWLKWHGHNQPLGSNTYESVKAYINHCIRLGNCKLSEFEIFTKYGQIKTSIINDKDADPTLTINYSKVW